MMWDRQGLSGSVIAQFGFFYPDEVIPPDVLEAGDVYHDSLFMDVWHDAKMDEVIQYLSASRSVALPAEWDHIPPLG